MFLRTRFHLLDSPALGPGLKMSHGQDPGDFRFGNQLRAGCGKDAGSPALVLLNAKNANGGLHGRRHALTKNQHDRLLSG
jgi:hypothetical protein